MTSYFRSFSNLVVVFSDLSLPCFAGLMDSVRYEALDSDQPGTNSTDDRRAARRSATRSGVSPC